MTAHRKFLLNAAILLLAAAPARSQQTLVMVVQLGAQQAVLSNGGTLNLSSPSVGHAASAKVRLEYRGDVTATLTRAESFGAPEVTLTTPSPRQLRPNDAATFDIQFLPVTKDKVTAQVQIVVEFATEPVTSGALSFAVTGGVPDLAIAYSLQSDGNAIPVASGNAITLPATAVNAVTAATLAIVNRGSAALTMNSASFRSDTADLQALGLPLTPGSLPAGSSITITVRYTPRQRGTAAATLEMSFDDKPFTLSIQASAIGPVFAYEWIDGETVNPFAPNGRIALPSTKVGESATYLIRVKNQGDGDGAVAGVGLVGAGLQIPDAPTNQSLAPGGSLFFSLVFAPTRPEKVAGRLRIGNDLFEISVTALGPLLSYSYDAGTGPVAVLNFGVVSLAAATVGTEISAAFIVTNDGTAPASVVSAGVTTGSPFRLVALPSLPATLAPGGKIKFTIAFLPSIAGLQTSVLRVDGQQFTLSGVATAIAGPEYRFEGTQGTVQPADQPSIGLTLTQPYPGALQGTLTISFASDTFAIDPAVQFATGGTTVPFTIAPNTTSAVFPNSGNRIRLQTGTVAGTILLTPSFTTAAGANVTPDHPVQLSLIVPRAAPRLLSVDVAAQAANSFVVTVTGYSSSRALKTLLFRFTGKTAPLGDVPVDAESTAAVWYRSSASQGYGSLFQANVAFTVQGSKASLLSDLIAGISVTASNDMGVSGPLDREIN